MVKNIRRYMNDIYQTQEVELWSGDLNNSDNNINTKRVAFT